MPTCEGRLPRILQRRGTSAKKKCYVRYIYCVSQFYSRFLLVSASGILGDIMTLRFVINQSDVVLHSVGVLKQNSFGGKDVTSVPSEIVLLHLIENT